MIDACYTLCNIVNSRVTESHEISTQFSEIIAINLLKIAMLQSILECQYAKLRWVGKLCPSVGKNCTLYPHNLWDYWTEVHQIFTQ